MRHDDMNGARARSMRIRQAHDMEATELRTLNHGTESQTTGVLVRLIARATGRFRAEIPTQLARPEQLAAIQSPER